MVKRNQKTLHRQIERGGRGGLLRLSNHAVESQAMSTKAISCFEQTEKTRNRLIHRTVEVFDPPSKLDSRWVGVNSIIKIFRSGIRGERDYQSPSATYDISSLPPTSSLIPQGIRRHWSIENRLHWIKDVVTQEDSSPQLQGQASTNISLIKSWVINLLRVNGFDSLTEALDYMSNNLSLLLSFCY